MKAVSYTELRLSVLRGCIMHRVEVARTEGLLYAQSRGWMCSGASIFVDKKRNVQQMKG